MAELIVGFGAKIVGAVSAVEDARQRVIAAPGQTLRQLRRGAAGAREGAASPTPARGDKGWIHGWKEVKEVNGRKFVGYGPQGYGYEDDEREATRAMRRERNSAELDPPVFTRFAGGSTFQGTSMGITKGASNISDVGSDPVDGNEGQP